MNRSLGGGLNGQPGIWGLFIRQCDSIGQIAMGTMLRPLLGVQAGVLSQSHLILIIKKLVYKVSDNI